MKKMIIIFLVLCCQAAYPQWEKVDLCSDSTFVIDECSGDTLIFGKQDSLILSTDFGKSWKDIYDKLPSPTVIKFKDNIIALGSWRQGLFISIDLGDNWTKRVNGLPDRAVINTILLFGDKIFAGLDGGMFVSTDLGENWILQNNGIEMKIGFNYTIVFDINTKESNIFSATASGIYLSTDNGESWLPKNNGLPIESIYFRKIEISGENIYAIEMSSDWSSQIYLSTNMGVNWSKTNNKFLYKTILRSMKAIENNIFAATNRGLYLSKDKGDNWDYIDFGTSSADTSISSLFIIDDYIYANVHYLDNTGEYVISSVFRARISDFTDVNNNSELTKKIQINPNPSSDYIFIGTYLDLFQINIYNFLGMKVLSEENQKKIDVSSLPPGLYFCHVVSGNHSEIRKFAIIR